MDFSLTEEQKRVQAVCRELTKDFATRAAEHDRNASLPVENYQALCQAGLYGLAIPKELGGLGVGFLGYVVVAEELAQGCASTALTFNMHAAATGIVMEDATIAPSTKRYVADLAITHDKLFCTSVSEPATSGLIATAYTPSLQARRVKGGYLLNGRKMFASMMEASDYAYLYAHPEEDPNPLASLGMLVPHPSPGLQIEHVWDTLGMRGTRSDTVVYRDCLVPEELLCLRTDNFLESFIVTGANWSFGAYTAIYLGVGVGMYKEAVKTVQNRVARGYAQPMSYHPNVRQRVAEMNADLEAARLLMHHVAWLQDTQGPSLETFAAFLRAKYFVGEAVARTLRSALTMCGAHALFKTSAIERFYRDGASAPIMPPSSDAALDNLGALALGLDLTQVLPPLKVAG
jgi:alkylation response protein AidB-like acyl-CoA dehydrogenase